MVKVANDPPLPEGDLPAAGRSGEPEPEVSGISLRLIAGLAATAHGVVRAEAARLDVSVDSTTPLRSALRDDPPARLTHRLVLADAAALAEQDGDAASLAATVAALDTAGAAGLVVSGLSGRRLAALVKAAESTGLPLIDVPLDHIATFTTDVLSAMLEHQTAILRRLEDADRALVQIVLAGGSLDDLCEQVVGFLDGAVMVTTTDGRVIARAGSPQELERTLSLECFDRTGRLLTEAEPMGPRPDGPTANRSAVRIVAGHLDHGVLMAFCSHRHLTVDDVRLLERAATVAALAITKDQAVSAVESKYRAEFLRDALAGRAGAPAEAITHAAALGWDIDRPMVVVVAVPDSRSPVMGFSREVVALIGVPSEAETDQVMRIVGEYVRVVRGDGGGGRRSFSAGVSRPIGSVAGLPQAYEEALAAVTV